MVLSSFGLIRRVAVVLGARFARRALNIFVH